MGVHATAAGLEVLASSVCEAVFGKGDGSEVFDGPVLLRAELRPAIYAVRNWIRIARRWGWCRTIETNPAAPSYRAQLKEWLLAQWSGVKERDWKLLAERISPPMLNPSYVAQQLFPLLPATDELDPLLDPMGVRIPVHAGEVRAELEAIRAEVEAGTARVRVGEFLRGRGRHGLGIRRWVLDLRGNQLEARTANVDPIGPSGSMNPPIPGWPVVRAGWVLLEQEIGEPAGIIPLRPAILTHHQRQKIWEVERQAKLPLGYFGLEHPTQSEVKALVPEVLARASAVPGWNGESSSAIVRQATANQLLDGLIIATGHPQWAALYTVTEGRAPDPKVGVRHLPARIERVVATLTYGWKLEVYGLRDHGYSVGIRVTK